MASIDIGTNSMRLLIADYKDGEFSNKEKYINTTRMGRGKDRYGMISAETISENALALRDFVSLADKKGACRIIVMGTSALRDAQNRDEFLQAAREIAGINVEIITGTLEASLGFYGVRPMLDDDSYNLIVDVGGGSTEFILGDKTEEIVFSKSLNIGAVRLTQQYMVTDPPELSQLALMEEEIEAAISSVTNILREYRINKLIGIGGTATSISTMAHEIKQYDSAKVHGSTVSLGDVCILYDEVCARSLSQRQMMTGLEPKRADVIIAGVAIVKKIMELMSFEKMYISDYDNLEGMIYYKMQ